MGMGLCPTRASRAWEPRYYYYNYYFEVLLGLKSERQIFFSFQGLFKSEMTHPFPQ